MSPEAERFLQNADDHLKRGQTMLATGLDEDAGRAAYLAAFHAAQALVFERISKVFKSHKGVHIEFLRLTKDDPRFTRQLRRFLSRSYGFNAGADFDTGSITEVSRQQAVDAVETAREFVACFCVSAGHLVLASPKHCPFRQPPCPRACFPLV